MLKYYSLHGERYHAFDSFLALCRAGLFSLQPDQRQITGDAYPVREDLNNNVIWKTLEVLPTQAACVKMMPRSFFQRWKVCSLIC